MYFQHGEGPVEEHFIPPVGVRTQAEQNAARCHHGRFRARAHRVPEGPCSAGSPTRCAPTARRSMSVYPYRGVDGLSQRIQPRRLPAQDEDALCTACVDTAAHFHQRQSVGAGSAGQRRACGQTSRNGRAVINLRSAIPGPSCFDGLSAGNPDNGTRHDIATNMQTSLRLILPPRLGGDSG